MTMPIRFSSDARAWTRTRQLCPCSRSHFPPWKRIWWAALKTKSFAISKTGTAMRGAI